MFQQDYGSKDTRWLYWFMGVMIIYALLTSFPETERLAGWIGTALTVLGVFLFHVAIVRWFRGKLFPSREEIGRVRQPSNRPSLSPLDPESASWWESAIDAPWQFAADNWPVILFFAALVIVAAAALLYSY